MIRAAIRAVLSAVVQSVIGRSDYKGETLSLDFTTQTYRIEV